MPMWPTWWWPQALMQPEMLSLIGPILFLRVKVGKLARDGLRNRDGARRRQRTIIQAGAGDDITQQAIIGGGQIMLSPVLAKW